MGTVKLSLFKTAFIVCSITIFIISFQNCSKNETSFNSASIVSTQCASKIKSSTLSLIANADQLRCTSKVNYSCESRVFKESVQNEVHDSSTCTLVDAKEFCIHTTIRNFNTSLARNIASLDENQFNEGGEFNRQESNCSYFDITEKMSLLRSDADTTEQALENLIAKCFDAQKLKE